MGLRHVTYGMLGRHVMFGRATDYLVDIRICAPGDLRGFLPCMGITVVRQFVYGSMSMIRMVWGSPGLQQRVRGRAAGGAEPARRHAHALQRRRRRAAAAHADALHTRVCQRFLA